MMNTEIGTGNGLLPLKKNLNYVAVVWETDSDW